MYHLIYDIVGYNDLLFEKFDSEYELLNFMEGKYFYYLKVIKGVEVKLKAVEKVTKWEVVR